MEEQGIIQFFEYTYELGWNVLKDFLAYQGDNEIYGSRDAVRKGFKAGLVADGEGWMDMYQSRTKTSHTYNEDTAREVVDAITSRYYFLLESFNNKMESLIKNGLGT